MHGSMSSQEARFENESSRGAGLRKGEERDWGTLMEDGGFGDERLAVARHDRHGRGGGGGQKTRGPTCSAIHGKVRAARSERFAGRDEPLESREIR